MSNLTEKEVEARIVALADELMESGVLGIAFAATLSAESNEGGVKGRVAMSLRGKPAFVKGMIYQLIKLLGEEAGQSVPEILREIEINWQKQVPGGN